MFQTIGFSMLAVSIILLVIALILAVVWHIPSLMDELSGRKARRQIDRMRKLNLASSNFSVTDTSEFYKSMNGGDLVPRGVYRDKNATSKLGKMVDDPYHSVGSEKDGSAGDAGNADYDKDGRNLRRTGNASEDVIRDFEDKVTSFMEEEAERAENLQSRVSQRKRYVINLVKEQTSL